MRFSRIMLIGSVLFAACSSDNSDTTPQLAGTYVATTFVVTPSGQPAADILAAGGSLNITISASGVSSGTLGVPNGIYGGGTAGSMAGTATVTNGTQVTFAQNADTFVRDLPWTLSTANLSVTSQIVSGTAYTIVLTRQ